MEFLTGLIIGISIGFVWGVWRATQSFIERIINQPEEIQEIIKRVNQSAETDQSESQTVVEYTTEWHNDVCYLYDNKGKFIAQGNSVTEAMERAEKRFPGLKLNFRIKDPD